MTPPASVPLYRPRHGARKNDEAIVEAGVLSACRGAACLELTDAMTGPRGALHTMAKLTDTQLIVRSKAAAREDGSRRCRPAVSDRQPPGRKKLPTANSVTPVTFPRSVNAVDEAVFDRLIAAGEDD
jgi:hypothetical protein